MAEETIRKFDGHEETVADFYDVDKE